MIALFPMISTKQHPTDACPPLFTPAIDAAPGKHAARHGFPAAAQPTQIHDNTDPGFGAQGSVEIIASIPDLDPSGIAVIGGRLFLSFQHDGDHAGPTLGNGAMAASSLFPNAAMASSTSGNPSERLVSIHGLTADTQGHPGRSTMARCRGSRSRPAARNCSASIRSGRVTAKVILRDALLPGSHMNDLRIDLTHGAQGTAYISDSSFDGHPALVVVDIASGRQRRCSATIRASRRTRAIRQCSTAMCCINSPATPPSRAAVSMASHCRLTAPGSTFAPLASRRLYSIPTALLADFTKDDAAGRSHP
jgi:hypothetical protein